MVKALAAVMVSLITANYILHSLAR